MDKIIIEGGAPLKGVLPISGSKNAVLPLMVAALLTEETLTLEMTPRLADTRQLGELLRALGVAVEEFGEGDGESISLNAAQITSTRAPYELVKKMRASFWVLGGLLARCGAAQVSLPGGCAIGTRPVDLYLQGLEKMGAQIAMDGGYVVASAKHGLHGTDIELPFVSVGATHVLMQAASLADGTTRISNAAAEPEVVDVANCLKKMGAKIDGVGTNILTIEGVAKLSGANYRVQRDRIEAGAFACAVAASGVNGAADVLLANVHADILGAALPLLRQAGVEISEESGGVRVKMSGRAAAVSLATAPYPGFPTDLQAPFMGLAALAEGVSEIRETIFENRFMHVQELVRMGADIKVSGDTARINGVASLSGAPIMATDLRASIALVIAALAAQGQTQIARVYHLDRGYERLEEKLRGCGAQISRTKI